MFARNITHNLKRIIEITEPSGLIQKFDYINYQDGYPTKIGPAIDPSLLNNTQYYLQSKFYMYTAKDYLTSNIISSYEIYMKMKTLKVSTNIFIFGIIEIFITVYITQQQIKMLSIQ